MMDCIDQVKRVTQRRAPAYLCCLLLLLATWIAPTTVPAAAQTPPAAARGKANVAVMVNIDSPSALDQINITIVDRADERLLTTIAGLIAKKVNALPENLKFTAIDQQYNLDEKGIGLDFQLALVEHASRGVLPTVPFIEAFAPYVSQLRIIYVLNGSYQCDGLESYPSADVTITPDPPALAPGNNAVPVAFYSADILIKNASPSVVAPSIPSHQGQKRIYLLLELLLIAALIGITVGVLLSRQLSRWRAKVAPDGTAVTSSERDNDHDRRDLQS